MGKQHTILIADDEPNLLRALKIRLESHGYRVVTASDGYQALQQWRTHKPDLVLLDIHMPAGDGLSVHERVLNSPDIPPAPLIYMTSDRSLSLLKRADDMKATGVLHKPIWGDEVLRILSSILDKDQAAVRE